MLVLSPGTKTPGLYGVEIAITRSDISAPLVKTFGALLYQATRAVAFLLSESPWKSIFVTLRKWFSKGFFMDKF